MLPCSVVQDLLPAHLEGLDSKETSRLVEEHLAACPACRESRAAMEAEVPLKKAEISGLGFLKKLRRRNLIAAAVTALAAVVLLALLYRMEFIDIANTATVEAVITDRIDAFQVQEVNVLESQKVGRSLYVLYEQLDDDSDTICGVARFRQGLFGGYCLRWVVDSSWPLYGSTVQKGPFQSWLVVYGVNAPEADSFRLYPEDMFPDIQGQPGRDLTGVEPLYTGTVEAPYLDIVPITNEQAKQVYQGHYMHYYDAEGTELDSRELAEAFGYDGSSGGGWSPSSMGMFYFLCGLVAALGIVMIRYFLFPETECGGPRHSGEVPPEEADQAP